MPQVLRGEDMVRQTLQGEPGLLPQGLEAAPGHFSLTCARMAEPLPDPSTDPLCAQS